MPNPEMQYRSGFQDLAPAESFHQWENSVQNREYGIVFFTIFPFSADMKLLLLHKKIRLQKFPGKGGWTYAAIPKVIDTSGRPFGWVMVDAEVDGMEIKDIKLMPMGNGRLFLLLKAALRKQISKEEGDEVEIKIYANNKISS